MQEERYTGDGVIALGHDIYDEWNNKKYSSRKIVASVRLAVDSMNAEKSVRTRLRALSYLFALDLRINQRYSSLLRCILLYFAWRRETELLKWLKGQFNMSFSGDLRGAIEVELNKMREMLGEDREDATNKNIKGGKISEFEGYEQPVTEDEILSENTEENPERERLEAEEKAEEGAEIGYREPVEEHQAVENAETVAEVHQSIAENAPEVREEATADEKVEIRRETLYDNKTENNGSSEKQEPSIDKTSQPTGFSGAIDVVPLFEAWGKEEAEDATIFIDEVIMDNMIKGHKDIISHNPLADVNKDPIENRAVDVEMPPIDKIDGDKDSYLYDKMVLSGRSDGKTDGMQSEQKPLDEKPQTSVEKNPIEDGDKAQINADDNPSQENVIPEEMIPGDAKDIIASQMMDFHKSIIENVLREEIEIAGAELGIDAPIQIIEGGNSNNKYLSDVIPVIKK